MAISLFPDEKLALDEHVMVAPLAARLAQLDIAARQEIFANFGPHRLHQTLEHWPIWARPQQMTPNGNWRLWLFLGGRGAGKTRAMAEWMRARMESGLFARAALIGPTFADVRDIMIEGPSGLMEVASGGFRPKLEMSRRRLKWPNGAEALLFSAEDPESLRGPQFDSAWGDEFAAWRYPQQTLDILRPALRLGDDPRLVLSTTPRPIPALEKLLADPSCVVSRGATKDNHAFLPAGLVEDLEARWAGSIWARQELYGEMIHDPEGALWTREMVEKARAKAMPENFDRIIIAIDPPTSAHKNSDACGMVVAARAQIGEKPHGFILDDLSFGPARPEDWAARAIAAYHQYGADCLLAEANQGGEMVRTILANLDPNVPVRLVHARQSKTMRAEPISLLYHQGRVCHAKAFVRLEDEMCRFGAPGFSGSPDRMDALVWALSHLILLPNKAPKARTL